MQLYFISENSLKNNIGPFHINIVKFHFTPISLIWSWISFLFRIKKLRTQYINNPPPSTGAAQLSNILEFLARKSKLKIMQYFRKWVSHSVSALFYYRCNKVTIFPSHLICNYLHVTGMWGTIRFKLTVLLCIRCTFNKTSTQEFPSGLCCYFLICDFCPWPYNKNHIYR